jgi:hypothetical protein
MTLVTNLYQRRLQPAPVFMSSSQVGPGLHVILSEGPLGPKSKDPPVEADHAPVDPGTHVILSGGPLGPKSKDPPLEANRAPVDPGTHVILSEGPLGPKSKDPPLEANRAPAAVSTSRGRPFDSLRSLRVTRWGTGSLRVTRWGAPSWNSTPNSKSPPTSAIWTTRQAPISPINSRLCSHPCRASSPQSRNVSRNTPTNPCPLTTHH